MIKSWSYLLLAVPLISGCGSKNNDANDSIGIIDDPDISEVYYGEGFDADMSDDESGLSEYWNSVAGHKEESRITGNFTGIGIDTLYVIDVPNEDADNLYDRVKFYAKSNNPRLPEIELYGCGYMGDTPKLVFEGDVDGDGKDEWGYLHTWVNSQWRYYRIYNYDSKRKKWRFLYYDADQEGISLLETPEYVRASGVDIVEKGPQPGTIKINYGTYGPDVFELRDTVVKPTYTPITE